MVPSHLEHDSAWARVAARPAHDVALNVHTVDGGEREAYRIFQSIFYSPCEQLRPIAAQLPGASVTDAFWRGLAATHAFAEQLVAGIAAAPTLHHVQDRLRRASRGY